MKKISLYHSARLLMMALCLCFTVTSCDTDEILEPKLYNTITPSNFYQSEADFEAALTGFYALFTANWGLRDPGADNWYNSVFNANLNSYAFRGEFITDEMHTSWNQNLVNFTWTPATFQSNGSSGSTYSKIRYVARLTGLLENIEESSVEEDQKALFAGEAKILRAWLMYILYDFFGPLNVKLDPATLSSTKIEPRLSDEAYVGQMVKDLNEAIATPNMPDAYNDSDWGRVGKSVARMLLLKIYMHTKNWSEAERVGKEIIDSKIYSLQANYTDVFTQNRNYEVIYAVQTNEGAPNWYMQHLFPGNFSKGYAGDILIERGGGWYGYSMPWEFYDKFESGDSRQAAIISEYETRSGDIIDRTDPNFLGAIPLKYVNIVGPGPGYGDIDWVVFRYAEVLLSVAEAINEQRGPDDAYQYVNQVRQRAGVSDFAGMSQDEFRDAILDERGRELFVEGARRQDLVRHGKLIEKALERGALNAEPKHNLFPIPINVMIEANGVIEQNPGY